MLECAQFWPTSRTGGTLQYEGKNKVMKASKPIAVGGHICVDQHESPRAQAVPGGLQHKPHSIYSTGGCVANVGVALRKLGVPTLLVAKYADDYLGYILKQELEKAGLKSSGLFVSRDENDHTSHSVVMNFPGIDRSFYHDPGCNDSFRSSEIDYHRIGQSTSAFHFGYPPLMRMMYINDGEQVTEMFRTVREWGVHTSLDLVDVDPSTEAGQADWGSILRNVLPYVDLFTPSEGELRKLVPEFRSLGDDMLSLRQMAETLLTWKTKAVLIKLGANGMYFRSGPYFGLFDDHSSNQWMLRELWGLPFKEKHFKGSCGAGDSAIAGFLAAMYNNLWPTEALRFANAVGTCCVECPDASSGILTFDHTRQRIDNGWENLDISVSASWKQSLMRGVYAGTEDEG